MTRTHLSERFGERLERAVANAQLVHVAREEVLLVTQGLAAGRTLKPLRSAVRDPTLGIEHRLEAVAAYDMALQALIQRYRHFVADGALELREWLGGGKFTGQILNSVSTT